MARLLVFRGDLVDREIDLGVTSIRIGRGADNDVVLEDPEKGVSRSHAELRYENGRYVLVDLGSQNGIFQDGARVERAYFRPNGAIVVGSFQLMIDESAGWPAEGGGHPEFSDATVVPSHGRGGYTPPGYGDPGDSRDAGPASGAVPAAAKPSWVRENARMLWLSGGTVVVASAIGLGLLLSGGNPDRLTREQIEEHISEAGALIDNRDPRGALDLLEQVLKSDPDHAEALALKLEAEELLKRSQVSGQETPVTRPEEPPSPVRPPPAPPVRENPISLPPPVNTADRELNARFAEARIAVERGDVVRAEEIVRTLPASDARVQDLQRSIRQRRRTNAEELARQAAEEARNGRWLAALETYERARAADPQFQVDAQVADVRRRMHVEADGKLSKADVEFRYTASDPVARQTALRLYEEAVKLMADHPRLAEVNQRIKELRGK